MSTTSFRIVPGQSESPKETFAVAIRTGLASVDPESNRRRDLVLCLRFDGPAEDLDSEIDIDGLVPVFMDEESVPKIDTAAAERPVIWCKRCGENHDLVNMMGAFQGRYLTNLPNSDIDTIAVRAIDLLTAELYWTRTPAKAVAAVGGVTA